MYTVNPKEPNSNYVKVSVSEYVTLTNGQKLRFMGWNTMPDGTGDMYSGEGGVFDSPNKNTDYPLAANGTLYAFWDSPLDRLEIHKDLFIDPDENASGRYKTDFTFTVTLTLPVNLEIDSDMKIIAEEFYAADDSLVPNSQQNISLQGTQKEYKITFTFNEDQYGVVYAPKGTTYEVTETLPSGNDYTLINSVNTQGVIEGVGEGNDVRFTNGWRNTTGMLDIAKVVSEGIDDDWQTQEFEFAVNFTNPADVTQNYTYQKYDDQNQPAGDPVTVTSSPVNFTIKHGERVVFTGLKEDTQFTVAEMPAESYAPTVTVNGNECENGSGTITANQTQTVVVTNAPAQRLSDLTIVKTVNNLENVADTFVFTVTGPENFNKTVVINGSGSVTIADLPIGQYTVTEDIGDGHWTWRYTCSPENGSITKNISPEDDNTFAFTNTFKPDSKWLTDTSYAKNIFGSEPATIR